MNRSSGLDAAFQGFSILTKARGRQRIVVPTSAGDLILDADEIDWIEADDYYAAIHARNGRHLIRESLASLEQRLDHSQFLRTHRSAIVNLSRVCRVNKEKGQLLLVLRNGNRIPVSRRQRARVIRTLRRPDKSDLQDPVA